MKTLMAAISAIILFLLNTAIMAEAAKKEYKHTVVKGDCVTKLAIKYGYGNWKELAKIINIKGPKYMICIGQKLIIPSAACFSAKKKQSTRIIIVHLGRSPLMPHLTPKKMLNYNFIKLGKALELSEEETEELKKKIKGSEWENVMVEAAYNDGKPAIQYSILTFKNYRRLKNVAPAWKGRKKAFRVNFADGKIIDFILLCGNAGRREQPPVEKIPPVVQPPSKPPSEIIPPVVQPPSKPPSEIIPPPIETLVPPEFPPPPPEKPQAKIPCSDLYIGGGLYDNVHSDQNADGGYGWIKGRIKPIKHTSKGGFSVCLGVFGFGAFGSGHDNDYSYRWYEYNFGPTVKLMDPKNNWDADLDFIGIGNLYSKGKNGSFENWQNDHNVVTSEHLNIYGRRARGEKLFPKTEFNFEGRFPFKSRGHSEFKGQNLESPIYDNRRIELFVNQAIYDYNLNSTTRVTPGFEFGIGRAYGLKQNFYQLGPNVVVSFYNQDICKISIGNYKEMLGGEGDQWHWLSGWISVDGVYNAYRAAKIKPANQADIEKRRLSGASSQSDSGSNKPQAGSDMKAANDQPKNYQIANVTAADLQTKHFGADY